MSSERSADVRRIEQMMRERGVFTDAGSGREYFTGYDYETLYDWDQYFEAIVQLYVGWDTRLIVNGVQIFLDNEDETGFIHRSVPRCKAPGYGQGDEHVKPFLAQIALLVHRHDGHLDWLDERHYTRLTRYIDYWLTVKCPDDTGLAVWDSAPHTGMDNQHERAGYWYDCFCQGVDLNCYLVRECRAMARVAALKGRPEDEARYLAHAERLKAAVQTLWDERDGFFYDRDVRTGAPIPIKYAGAFASLWAGVATPAQAERLVREHIANPAEFWRAFPLPAYAATEPGYTTDRLEGDLGCNWRAFTWIPTNYYTFHGLMDYGYEKLAAELAKRTLEKVRVNGDCEYYVTDVDMGVGLKPFWGWSLLAYFMPYEAETNTDPTRI